MEQITQEDFAEFLYNMRRSLGLSREGFSKLSGFSPITLASWEKQSAFPRYVDEKIEKIREVVKAELSKRRKAAKYKR